MCPIPAWGRVTHAAGAVTAVFHPELLLPLHPPTGLPRRAAVFLAIWVAPARGRGPGGAGNRGSTGGGRGGASRGGRGLASQAFWGDRRAEPARPGRQTRDPCAPARRLRAPGAQLHPRPRGSGAASGRAAAEPREDALPCTVRARAPSSPQQVREGRRRRGRTTPETEGRKVWKVSGALRPPAWGQPGSEPPPLTSGKPRLSPALLPASQHADSSRWPSHFPLGTSRDAALAPP